MVAAAAATIALLALSGCSAKKAPAGRSVGNTSTPGRTSGAPSSSPSVPLAVLSISAASGATSVSPTAPIRVGVTGGTISDVTMVNPEGKSVVGSLARNKLSWQSAEPLGYSRTYTLTAHATNPEGALTTVTRAFTTVTPNNLTLPYIQTAAGGAINPGVTFGVGQVVRIHFDEPIPDRKAAQSAISITTAPAQVGGFNWMSDQDLYWRTKDYLVPGTKVTISTNVYGKNLGDNLYGQADSSTWFKVGPKHVSIADDNTKLIQVYENDKLIRTMPTSMGRHTSIPGDKGPIDLRTNSGPHVVVRGETNINMNSASFGLSKGANAYKTIVPVGVRITYDGEYVHWADWSVWAQGNTDTSHGCLNVSPANAWWFYYFSQPGDIVDVRNTGRQLAVWNSGYWVDSWSEWTAGSA